MDRNRWMGGWVDAVRRGERWSVDGGEKEEDEEVEEEKATTGRLKSCGWMVLERGKAPVLLTPILRSVLRTYVRIHNPYICTEYTHTCTLSAPQISPSSRPAASLGSCTSPLRSSTLLLGFLLVLVLVIGAHTLCAPDSMLSFLISAPSEPTTHFALNA